MKNSRLILFIIVRFLSHMFLVYLWLFELETVNTNFLIFFVWFNLTITSFVNEEKAKL